MKTILTILLIALSVMVMGQTKTPLAWYKFGSINTYEDASGNGYTALPRGNVGYDPIYDGIYFDGNNDYISIPTMDLGTHFAVSFWAMTPVDVGETPSNFVHMGNPTTFWCTYLYNNQVRIGSTGSNNAYYGKWTKGAFHHIVIEINSTLARIFVDGSRAATQTDSTISATIPSNDSIYIGIGPSLSADYYGYITEFMVFKNLTVTSAVLDSLYSKKYLSDDPLQTYFPQTGQHVRIKKGGIELKDKADPYGFVYFRAKQFYVNTIPVAESNFNTDTLFADNFNDLPAGAITKMAIVNRWQAIAPNFRENNQSIVDKGSGNKVFRSKYDVGDCSTNQGIELGIMLDTVYKELYMDVNVCYSSGYDTEDAATGTYGGKSPNGGFWGGNHWNVAGTQTPWIIDTIADVHGWSAHNGMGSGANARLFAYIYEIRTWNKQYNFGYSTPNVCHIYTRRVKVNDPGQKNAIVATYIDGVLAQQIDTLWFQSVTQLNKNLQFIEGAVIKHSINDCTDEAIYVDIDNIVVYRKGVDNPGYLPGPAPIGHTITPLSGTVTTNKFQKPIFFNATRTAASGTIKSHYTGASFHPSKLDGTTYTTVVNNAGGAKKIKFTFWHDGTNNVDAATGMWVKVYSGIGTGGTLLYTWDEAIYTGVPTINQEYSVPTTFTVEFHPSSDLDLGFSLDYYLQ